jgi:putative membrane protein
VYDAGDDPDPRLSLANERTLLAWTRTSLALTAGAVAVHAPVLDFSVRTRAALSIALLLLAAVGLAQGWYRWRRTEIAVRTGAPLPGFAGGIAFVCGVAAVVAGLVVAALVSL